MHALVAPIHSTIVLLRRSERDVFSRVRTPRRVCLEHDHGFGCFLRGHGCVLAKCLLAKARPSSRGRLRSRREAKGRDNRPFKTSMNPVSCVGAGEQGRNDSWLGRQAVILRRSGSIVTFLGGLSTSEAVLRQELASHVFLRTAQTGGALQARWMETTTSEQKEWALRTRRVSYSCIRLILK